MILGLRGSGQVSRASVKDTEAEACWTAISGDDRYACVTNFGTGSISSYSIHADGRITLLQAVAGRTESGFGPRDEVLSADGRSTTSQQSEALDFYCRPSSCCKMA